ncbi:hypothetical protein [Thalassoroseus pseudoceratinae]|nr:hypothetical protein [Thalassoroseus pseudoceratinae]
MSKLLEQRLKNIKVPEDTVLHLFHELYAEANHVEVASSCVHVLAEEI